MNSGHVYVIAFDNGTLKVGRSQDMGARLKTHEQAARGFGLRVTDRWSSPEHNGWIENESALKRLAEGLGGIRRSDEWFAGVDFGELVAKAADLKFPEPRRTKQAVPGASRPTELPAVCKSFGTPSWLAEAADRLATTGIPLEGVSVEQAVTQLRNRILANRPLMQSLADDFARTRLRGAIVGANLAASRARRVAA
jgi:hypothetical protein